MNLKLYVSVYVSLYVFFFLMSLNVSVPQSSVVMCALQWQMSNDSFNHEIYISPANGLPKNSIHFIFSGHMTTLCVRVEISACDFSCLIRLGKRTAEYLSLICRHGYLITGQSAQSEQRNMEH